MPVATTATSEAAHRPVVLTHVPPGTVATGVDLAWVTDNAEEIAKHALAQLGYKWDTQSAANKKNWVENIHLFAEAAMALAKKEKKTGAKA